MYPSSNDCGKTNGNNDYYIELAVFGTKDDMRKLMSNCSKFGIKEDYSWNENTAFPGKYGTDFHIIFRPKMTELTVHPNRNAFYENCPTIKMSQYTMKEVINKVAKVLNRQPIEIEEPKVTVGGYEVQIIDKNTTKIAGFVFDRRFWEAAAVVSNHTKATIKVGCNHQYNLEQSTIEKVLMLMAKFKKK